MNRLLEKYKKIQAPVKASFWFVVANVLTKGISFITLPIFSRLLTTSDYGIMATYSSWVSIISILSTLTIWGGVFNVVMVNYPEKKDRIISSFQGLAISLTLIFLLFALVFIKPTSIAFQLPERLTVFVFIEVLVQIPYNLWCARQRFEYKYRGIIITTLFVAIANPMLGYYAVVSSQNKVEARIVSGLALQIILGVICFIVDEIKGKKFFDKEFWLYALKFNIVLVPHYLAMQVINQSDRLMISAMCGSSDAGIYSVAYTFAMLIQLVTNGINSSFTPHIYQSVRNKKEEQLARQTNGIVLIVAVMVIGIICIVPDIFKWMLPETYYPAIWVIPPIAVSAFFMFLYPLFGAVEFYYKENRYITVASLMGAITNIVLNAILIKIFGFIAAAYTTLACYILFSIFHYYFMRKILKKNRIDSKIYDVRFLGIVSIAVIITSIGITVIYNNLVIRWGVILILATLCMVNYRKLLGLLKEFTKKE